MTAARRNTALFFAALFAVTLALRLCHSHILWADEDYHLAAGIQTLHGKLLYRDLWYDKPPLSAWLYAALGAFPGWSLRLFDAVYILAACAAIWLFARDLWSRREAFVAAAMLAFFLDFDFAFAVVPIAPDLFLLLPHIAAVHCAWKRRPLAAGLWCGVGFLFHTKAVFVLAACALLLWRGMPALFLGFLIPNAAVWALLAAAGAFPDYIRQVWQWGLTYTRSSSELNPTLNALRRTAGWFGFHAALAIGAAAFWWRNRTRTHLWLAAWLLLAFAGVALGGRFFERYYLLLLPPLLMVASPALVRHRPVAILAAIALLVPFARFAPRYLTLAQDLLEHRAHQWTDILLDQDSQAAAALVNARRQPGDTLMVWGYRPGIFVYTRLPAVSRYWDSQPLTGVPADRHLRDAVSLIPDWAARNRGELTAAHPTFVVDSLSLSNPKLAIDSYPEMRPWLAGYRMVARTRLSLIYRWRMASGL